MKDAQRSGVNTASFLVPLSRMRISSFFSSLRILSLPMLKVFMLSVDEIMTRGRERHSLFAWRLAACADSDAKSNKLLSQQEW